MLAPPGFPPLPRKCPFGTSIHWQELGDATRPRPALKIRIQQRANMAKIAFRVANQAAGEALPYDDFIASRDQLLDALRAR